MDKSARYGGGARPVAGLEARRAALRLLDAVLRHGQRLDVASAHATRALALAEDRAFALVIASEVLRRLPDLDALIDSATPQPLPPDAKARSVLRIALVQALRLCTPPHAAISTALPLVEGGPKRLVHGVFGTLSRNGAALPDSPTLPQAVAGRWRAAWGEAMLADASRAIAEPPPLDLALRDDADDMEGDSLAPGHRRLPRGQNVSGLSGYDGGRFWVQNLSAQIPARLLGEGEGRRVLDLCAAPGGKTMQLAAAGWRVTALDSSTARMTRLRENLARTKLDAEIIEADVMNWQQDAPYEAILLDAPCTSTGIFARHPDVLHRIGDKDIAAMSALQSRMLARASGWLKPGAPLIYATCSLEPDEGEHVVRASSLAIDPIDGGTKEGWLRILPEPGRDGFFVARLRAAG